MPAGKWSIYRIGYAPTMKGPHPAPSGMKQCLEVDKMDKDANRMHWRNVIDPLKKNLGPLYGSSFNRLHIDSYECGCQNWTPKFAAQFLRLKGYDPVPWLVTFGTPVLGTDKWNGPMMSGLKPGNFSRIINDADQNGAFRLGLCGRCQPSLHRELDTCEVADGSGPCPIVVRALCRTVQHDRGRSHRGRADVHVLDHTQLQRQLHGHQRRRHGGIRDARRAGPRAAP